MKKMLAVVPFWLLNLFVVTLWAVPPQAELVESIEPADAMDELGVRIQTEQTLTLLKNDGNLLPLGKLDTITLGMVNIGADAREWQLNVERFAPVKVNITVERKVEDDAIALIEKQLEVCNLVIINISGAAVEGDDNWGIPYQTVKLVNLLTRRYPCIVNVLTEPAALKRIFGIRYAKAIVNSPWDGKIQRDLLSQALFGSIGFKGILATDASSRFPAGTGIQTLPNGRLKYTIPEELGINPALLAAADQYAMEGIQEGAYPGCQIIAAKDGKVFYAKAFGNHTFSGENPVLPDDIYDLASVTKIVSSTAAIMYLTDCGQFSVDSALGSYLPDLTQGTSFHQVKIRHMMTHQAGLHPWIPFYTKTLKNFKPDPAIYSDVPTETHTERVADNMYISREYRNEILKTIVNSGLSSYRKYKYSDLGYYLLQEIMERKTGQRLNELVEDVFYKPMGLSTLTYNPMERFDRSKITPSENDTIFRKQQLQGDVHDQGAAMMGGIAGHAGAFGNMYHVAAMMQMFQNYGEYAGVRYLNDATVKEFARSQYPGNGNRRGIGFDRPVPNRGPGPTCKSVTELSFGHTGFTGITAWADPGTGIVYVFLSNRCYPVAENNKILSLGTRTKIQQVLYDAVAASKK
jgi:CubicO group peptidase (beta-lactamase class C family)